MIPKQKFRIGDKVKIIEVAHSDQKTTTIIEGDTATIVSFCDYAPTVYVVKFDREILYARPCVNLSEYGYYMFEHQLELMKTVEKKHTPDLKEMERLFEEYIEKLRSELHGLSK